MRNTESNGPCPDAVPQVIGLFTRKEARRRRYERLIIAPTVSQSLTRDNDPDIVNWIWYDPSAVHLAGSCRRSSRPFGPSPVRMVLLRMMPSRIAPFRMVPFRTARFRHSVPPGPPCTSLDRPALHPGPTRAEPATGRPSPDFPNHCG